MKLVEQRGDGLLGRFVVLQPGLEPWIETRLANEISMEESDLRTHRLMSPDVRCCPEHAEPQPDLHGDRRLQTRNWVRKARAQALSPVSGTTPRAR